MVGGEEEEREEEEEEGGVEGVMLRLYPDFERLCFLWAFFGGVRLIGVVVVVVVGKEKEEEEEGKQREEEREDRLFKNN